MIVKYLLLPLHIGLEFPAKNLDTLSPIYTPERVRLYDLLILDCNKKIFLDSSTPAAVIRGVIKFLSGCTN